MHRMLRISCTGSRPVSHATSTSRVSLVPHFVFRSSPDACAPWSQCHQNWAKRHMSSVSSVRWWRRLRRRSWSRVHWAAMKQLLWMWHFPRLIWGNFAKQSSQTLPRVNFAVWRTASGQLWDRGRPMIHCRMPSVGTWHATSFLPALGAAFLPAMRCCCLPTGPSRAKLGCEPMPPRPWRCPALLKLQRHGGANPRWSWRKWRLKLCYGLGKLTFGRSATLRPFLSFLRLAISSAATRTGMGCLGLRTIEIGMPEDGFFSRGTKRNSIYFLSREFWCIPSRFLQSCSVLRTQVRQLPACLLRTGRRVVPGSRSGDLKPPKNSFRILKTYHPGVHQTEPILSGDDINF